MARSRVTSTPLARFLRDRRIELGLRQTDIAERADCGIRQGDVSNYERGTVGMPSYRILVGLASALQCPVGEFFSALGLAELPEPEWPDPDELLHVENPECDLLNVVQRLTPSQLRTLVRMARVMALEAGSR